MPFRLRLPLLTLLAVGLTTFASAAPVAFDEVRAIFEGKCLECHNPDKTKGKLLMTTREAFLKGGEGATRSSASTSPRANSSSASLCRRSMTISCRPRTARCRPPRLM